ncbi:FxSxx-COOH cyclophane-containing RiPP peptide [Actinomadura sp. WMMA1423]|uniref:FxSxx-COOH cyclophane-containing RiPP peptide n=1 Tax=Actinomadura sp. WMMA1423 TaxID=2591108 RepID=UPI00114700D6|nr:FxSxx-COOH cyclophane-containing RiPP peptide [Actinomadura sp. WMMA1423]
MQQEITLRDDLIDVSDLSLRELDELLGESAIARALREVLDPTRGDIVSAGFSSDLAEDPASAGL